MVNQDLTKMAKYAMIAFITVVAGITISQLFDKNGFEVVCPDGFSVKIHGAHMRFAGNPEDFCPEYKNE